MGNQPCDAGSGCGQARSRKRSARPIGRFVTPAGTGALAGAALLAACLTGAGAAEAAETRPAASLRDPTVRIMAPKRLGNGRVRECARVGWPKVPGVLAGGASATHRATVRHHVLRRSGGGAQPRVIKARRLVRALSPAGGARRYCITHDRATSRQLRRSRTVHWEAKQTVNSDRDPTYDAIALTSRASHPRGLGAVPCDMSSMDTITALTSCRNWTIFPSPNGNDSADDETLRKQLQFLYNKGFRGVSTYTLKGNMKDVPKIAKGIGFQKVIVGLWDPPREIAVIADVKDSIDGVMVGNEGLLRSTLKPPVPPYWTLAQLQGWVNDVRRGYPTKLVTTSDAWTMYFPNPGNPYGSAPMRVGDFLFPNLHAFWDNNPAGNGLFSANPNLGAEFVRLNVNKWFLDRSRNPKPRVVVLHESWWPSDLRETTTIHCALQPNNPPPNPPPPTGGQPYGGRPYTEAGQAQFSKELLTKQGVKFVWGEPFDIPTKQAECKTPPPDGYGGDPAPYWGLWEPWQNDTATPKNVTSVIDYGHY